MAIVNFESLTGSIDGIQFKLSLAIDDETGQLVTANFIKPAGVPCRIRLWNDDNLIFSFTGTETQTAGARALPAGIFAISENGGFRLPAGIDYAFTIG